VKAIAFYDKQMVRAFRAAHASVSAMRPPVCPRLRWRGGLWLQRMQIIVGLLRVAGGGEDRPLYRLSGLSVISSRP